MPAQDLLTMELKQQQCRKCDIMNIFGAKGPISMPSRPPSASGCIMKDKIVSLINERSGPNRKCPFDTQDYFNALRILHILCIMKNAHQQNHIFVLHSL